MQKWKTYNNRRSVNERKLISFWIKQIEIYEFFVMKHNEFFFYSLTNTAHYWIIHLPHIMHLSMNKELVRHSTFFFLLSNEVEYYIHSWEGNVTLLPSHLAPQVGKVWDDSHVDLDSTKEYLLIEELIVVVEEDRRSIHGGKPKCWDAKLRVNQIANCSFIFIVYIFHQQIYQVKRILQCI